MATYTHEDLKPRSKYFVTEVNGHVRVEDIDRWNRTRVWVDRYENITEFDEYEEAEDFVRRTNAEANSIIEDVERKGEESEHVEEEEDDEGYPIFYIEYVFDPIEEGEVPGLDDKSSFNGDTFKIWKTKWYERNRLSDKTFKNCKFIGGDLVEFENCKLFNCTFSGVNSIEIHKSRFEDCDFTQSSNILLDPIRAEIIRCKFDGARLKKHIRIDLSGTSGLSVEETDPNGDRRRNLSEDQLTVEEIASIREEEERLRREEEEARRKAVQDVTRRVSRAKKDKELEALAQEVGALQAQPQYVREYGRDLDDLQTQIEEKYSFVGKGIRYLKRLFSKGKRASQIRVASQMNRELQRDIRALKRDLDK